MWFESAHEIGYVSTAEFDAAVTDKYLVTVSASDGLLTSTATYTLMVDDVTTILPIIVNLPAGVFASEDIGDAIVIFTICLFRRFPKQELV